MLKIQYWLTGINYILQYIHTENSTILMIILKYYTQMQHKKCH